MALVWSRHECGNPSGLWFRKPMAAVVAHTQPSKFTSKFEPFKSRGHPFDEKELIGAKWARDTAQPWLDSRLVLYCKADGADRNILGMHVLPLKQYFLTNYIVHPEQQISVIESQGMKFRGVNQQAFAVVYRATPANGRSNNTSSTAFFWSKHRSQFVSCWLSIPRWSITCLQGSLAKFLTPISKSRQA